MKIKLTVAGADRSARDIALSCDVTTTVNQFAHMLLASAHFSDVPFEDSPFSELGRLTIKGRTLHDQTAYLLDPSACIVQSGLQSGWQVTVVREFGDDAHRLMPMLATVEVLNGLNKGAVFSVVAGPNTVGRDVRSRIVLEDRSVSRKHAVIEGDHRLVIRDLGSANGIEAWGQTFSAMPIERATEVRLGVVSVLITPTLITPTLITPAGLTSSTGQHASLGARPQLGYTHTRAPILERRFSSSQRELPRPPAPAPRGRLPMVALLTPMLMGAVLFAVTQSAMSLVMMGFTPLMMLGSWFDNLSSGRRKLKRELRDFERLLDNERSDLELLRDAEVSVRTAEAPGSQEVAAAILNRSTLLWCRHPESRGFLKLRFGEGRLPSRTKIRLPERGEIRFEEWSLLQSLKGEYAFVHDVPVIEHLSKCGSLAIIGDQAQLTALARSLVIQLVGLHSPTELCIVAFAPHDGAVRDWDWLKWLPHTDQNFSPIAAWQFGHDAQTMATLLTELEQLVGLRHVSNVAGNGEPKSAGHSKHQLPVIIVLVADIEIDDRLRSRLIALAERGANAAVHLLWMSASLATVPAACQTFITINNNDQQAAATVGFAHRGDSIALHAIESVSLEDAEQLARHLSSVTDASVRVDDESDLPTRVHFADLHQVDLLSGPNQILRNWNASALAHEKFDEAGHIVEREPVNLRAIVGQTLEGPLEVDLRAHGPHILVGGTTGSGKSEFLQTLIMSLAANVSPANLTFLLVDYKGGAAFAECVGLPHTVGLVTDLTPHLVKRALTSLRAELRYRERLLFEYGAKDLSELEQSHEAFVPPTLVIVIDEFATLAKDIPEFLDEILDVAQRGRSLGLHLVLATQRPAGVVSPNLRANTNLRIALRVADEVDSVDVIGTKDAAAFEIDCPGRGAIKLGSGRVTHFQTGYLGGQACNARETTRLEIRDLSFVPGEVLNLAQPDQAGANAEEDTKLRDIERLRDVIVQAAKTAAIPSPRRPWLHELPSFLALDDLETRDTRFLSEQNRQGKKNLVPIGLIDLPESQSQTTAFIDFEETGCLAIFGASGTGKTSALLTIAGSLSATAKREPVHLYAIDAAGGSLETLLVLPTVGAVAKLGDEELLERVLRHVRSVVTERMAQFSANRVNNLAQYRKVVGIAEPRVVLLIDGFSAFRQMVEAHAADSGPFQHLIEIMQSGRALGVHVVLTADRVGAVPSPFNAHIQRQLVLRMASPSDYAQLGVPAGALEAAPAGRAIFAGCSEELQLAVVGNSADFAEQILAFERLGSRLRQEGCAEAIVVRRAPASISLRELPCDDGGRPVIGLDRQKLTPLSMPLTGLGVIAGPRGSGLTTALLTCALSVERWAAQRSESAELVLLTFEPEGSGGLADQTVWSEMARGAAEVANLTRKLLGELGHTDRSRDSQVQSMHRVILVERLSDSEASESLPLLVALARAARRSRSLVLFEFELESASTVWELSAALKQPSWGLSLQPDERDASSPFRESFGRVKRGDFASGQGFTVESGRVTSAQLALVS